MSSSNLKIAIVGDCGVGKSSITIVFTYGTYIDEYDPTIEDSYCKQIKIDNESYIVEILDTAGPEDFRDLRRMYMRSNHVFILVYSITSKNSFSEIQSFYDQICEVVK
jgi:GTPase KRas